MKIEVYIFDHKTVNCCLARICMKKNKIIMYRNNYLENYRNIVQIKDINKLFLMRFHLFLFEACYSIVLFVCYHQCKIYTQKKHYFTALIRARQPCVSRLNASGK